MGIVFIQILQEDLQVTPLIIQPSLLLLALLLGLGLDRNALEFAKVLSEILQVSVTNDVR